jgi:hypothetical protein
MNKVGSMGIFCRDIKVSHNWDELSLNYDSYSGLLLKNNERGGWFIST